MPDWAQNLVANYSSRPPDQKGRVPDEPMGIISIQQDGRASNMHSIIDDDENWIERRARGPVEPSIEETNRTRFVSNQYGFRTISGFFCVCVLRNGKTRKSRQTLP